MNWFVIGILLIERDYPIQGGGIGKMLGIAHDWGQEMWFYRSPLQINNPTANFVYNAISTVRSVLPEELDSQYFKTRLSTLDKSIEINFGDPVNLAEVEEYGEKMGNFDEESQPFEHRLPIDDDAITHNSCADEGHAMPDQDGEPTPEQTDELVNTNVLLTRGGGLSTSHHFP